MLVALRHIIDALVEDWDRVVDLLGPDGRTDLRALIGKLHGAATSEERTRIALALTRMLGEWLPYDDPVFAKADLRYTSTSDENALDQVLISLSGNPLRYGRPRNAKERILTHRWESAAELREQGREPDAFGVIKLHRDDGSASVPLFQFDESGAPLEVVLRVNRLLRAHDDPWGAADWWFSVNAWLEEPPFELIGRTPDDRLVAAAIALVEG
ncbi:hypothetical protein GCM10011609_06930 [Lentzea pudingi]|uniref:Uncharacterized protein n=1 Tax=Lentzea pudingi TaxID=1789439 RepID=A0ABQ2HDC6_9PSEU|nr:hypothetical protein GCM10011609_06930 [Lentzea pudingi]